MAHQLQGVFKIRVGSLVVRDAPASETYWEKSSTKESEIYGVKPTWEFFVDAVKEQYYQVDNYEDQYMRWTTLWQEKSQIVS
jgi:hypothetical protein